jgi:hypothetical protein
MIDTTKDTTPVESVSEFSKVIRNMVDVARRVGMSLVDGLAELGMLGEPTQSALLPPRQASITYYHSESSSVGADTTDL